MSDTPRTDAKLVPIFEPVGDAPPTLNLVSADFARELERENTRLREALQGLVEWGAFGGEGLDDRSIPHYRRDYDRAVTQLANTSSEAQRPETNL